MSDRLPPPPFWRTRYFAEKVMNKPGRQIDPAEISATLAAPARRVIEPDGRVRHWRWVASRGRWLRMVTEADGVTVHNAFWDRSFRAMTKSPVGWEPVRYCVDTDTMTIEVRPWPGGPASRKRARTPASTS